MSPRAQAGSGAGGAAPRGGAGSRGGTSADRRILRRGAASRGGAGRPVAIRSSGAGLGAMVARWEGGSFRARSTSKASEP